jgi:hypothetical protein
MSSSSRWPNIARGIRLAITIALLSAAHFSHAQSDARVKRVAEIFSTETGRFFCPPLIFSDVGSPWLTLSEDGGKIVKISTGDGDAQFQRID